MTTRPNHARGCVKTRHATNSGKNRRSQFGYGAFLFTSRVIRILFSFFKIVFSEFSHSLALQRTRRERRGCKWCVPCADGTTIKLHRSADAGSLNLGR